MAWELSFDNVSTERKSLVWPSPQSLVAGYYAYEIQVWWEDDEKPLLLNTTRDVFYFPDMEPSIQPEYSTIGELSVKEHREIPTFQDVPKWSPGEEIDISLRLLDNSGEFEV